MTGIAKLRSLPEVVSEYDQKLAAIPEAVLAFRAAGDALKISATVGGEYGQETIDPSGRGTDEKTLERNLRRSAWLHVWNGLNLPTIASAKDKQKWQQALSDPPPFTLDNLRATFGPYLENPRLTILRGMADVFADLDPAFKSHEKMKIGVKGLPKRVVIHGFGGFIRGTYYRGGMEKVRDILNALAAYQGKPLVTYAETCALEKDGDVMRESRDVLDPHESQHVHRRRAEAGEPPKTIRVIGRGVWLKTFLNGNGHLFFGPDALRDINLALAEYYGDVLPDCPDWQDGERPAPRASTAVSKDLQFYPTPQAVIDRMIADLRLEGARVLEPSCGDGRIMVAARKAGAKVIGCEVDPMRAAMAEAKGFSVMRMNFLSTDPAPTFDFVVMNPPFYGRHYAKHVRHALRFLKPGGKLVAVLPATARYDHGLLDDLEPGWRDLPVGAFSESGTNVCTTIATIYAPRLA